MTKTEYLYRMPPSYFKNMLAVDASLEKIRLANEHIRDLLEVDLKNRDLFKIVEIQKAIEHHQFLVDEEDTLPNTEQDVIIYYGYNYILVTKNGEDLYVKEGEIRTADVVNLKNEYENKGYIVVDVINTEIPIT